MRAGPVVEKLRAAWGKLSSAEVLRLRATSAPLRMTVLSGGLKYNSLIEKVTGSQDDDFVGTYGTQLESCCHLDRGRPSLAPPCWPEIHCLHYASSASF